MIEQDRQMRSRLDSRSVEVLDAVVRLHGETGRPVSSSLVARFLPRSPSPATLRAVMKRLEEDGFLVQPHTSAGRLPTDAGYRLFVDRLRASWPLRRHDVPAQMVETARRAAPAPGGQDRVRDLARLLGLLTRNISIVVGPSLDGVKVERLECFPRSSDRALMVLILDNGQVRTRLVDLQGDFPGAVVTEATEILGRRLRGRSLGQLRREPVPALDLVRTPATRCAAKLAAASRVLLEDLESGEVEMDGVGRVLEEPEFQDTEPLKALIRFLESPRAIRSALNRLYRSDSEPFGVWIGRENPLGSLKRFTVITGSVEMQEGRGLLAVLGPRRLPYQRTFQGLEILRRIGGGLDPDALH